jgi:hypothetical protein
MLKFPLSTLLTLESSSKKTLRKTIVLGIFVFGLLGCSEDLYSPSQMWRMAQKEEPTLELVPIKDPSRRILCINFGPGCIKGTGKRVRIRRVELILVKFETVKQAQTEAYRRGQYYARNWVFDEMADEPVLIDFVTKVFGAKNAREELGEQ